jgi:hypothetical protein
MSCQALQRREQYDHQSLNNFSSNLGVHNDSTHSFADVQSAFSKTDTMKQFESSIKHNNPIYKDNEQLSQPYDNQPSQPYDNQLEIINSNLENYLKNIPDNDDSNPKIIYPLTRNQYYSPEQTGTELLEGYNAIDEIQQGYSDMDDSITKYTGMNIYKWILILFLLAVFIYALYCVCMCESGENFSGRRENLKALETQVKNLMNSNTKLFYN